jgi:hypothetical protein
MRNKSCFQKDRGSGMIGFKNYKEEINAIKDMWAETGLDTDCVDVAIIVEWFDKKRNIKEEDVKIESE